MNEKRKNESATVNEQMKEMKNERTKENNQ